MPASERRSLILRVGVWRAMNASCICCTVVKFCQNNVSLWASEALNKLCFVPGTDADDPLSDYIVRSLSTDTEDVFPWGTRSAVASGP